MDIELIDQAILMDIDTPEILGNNKILKTSRIHQLLRNVPPIFFKYRTPQPVIKHGEKVSEISCRIAELLNDSGNTPLDIELIKSAALLHDA